MWTHYLKIAVRNLRKRKMGAVINVAGLSVGLAACLLIYFIVASEWSFDRFHPDRERIYRVVADLPNPAGGKFYMPSAPYRAALAIKEFRGVEDMSFFMGFQTKVTVRDKEWAPAYPSDIMFTDPGFFAIFPRVWLFGDPVSALREPFRVVLTESKARTYFGDVPLDKVIGREVVYDDSLRLTVSGIVKDWNKNTDLIFKDFISLSTVQNSFLKDIQGLGTETVPSQWSWGDNEQVFVKLAKGETPSGFVDQAEKMFREHLTASDGRKVRMYLQPLSAVHFDADFEDFYSGKAHAPTLYGLMGIAVFILLLAVVNFINLSAAQSLQRAKEIGVRKVLGSDRRGLIRQFLTETFILVAMSGLLAVLIVRLVVGNFPSFFPAGTAVPLVTPALWIFLAFITLGTTLLAGYYPARVLSSWLPVLSLKGYGGGRTRNRNYVRKALIVFQFTMSIAFIISVLVVQKQLRFLLNKDLGFARDAIVTIPTSGNYATRDRNILADRIRQVPGVRMVSVSIEPPMIDRLRGGDLDCREKGTKVVASERVGDEFYVPLFGLKLVAGRNFAAPRDDTAGFIPSRIPYGYQFPKVRTDFLINETCARQLGFTRPSDALGHVVAAGDISGPVVGILADYHERSLFSPIGPLFVYGSRRPLWGELNVQLSGGIPYATVLAGIEQCWKGVYPSEPFDYYFLDKTIAGFYAREEQTKQVVVAATLIAIFISCIGLFGLISFTAEQKTREIGIRKVLGASVTGIVTLLSKDFLQLVCLSFVIASPLAFFVAHRWLQNFAYRIAIQWYIYALAGALALLIALVTVGFRAIRAATANPVKSLRVE
ncbi:ABC transporter permease [Dinghuibacter silviterrae]|nr:ABC transporter permease [Dinghuibacter silviterrae]